MSEIADFCKKFPELGSLLGADICRQLEGNVEGALKRAYSTLMRADGDDEKCRYRRCVLYYCQVKL